MSCPATTNASGLARLGLTVGYKRVGRLLEEMEIADAGSSPGKLRWHLSRLQLPVLDEFGCR